VPRVIYSAPTGARFQRELRLSLERLKRRLDQDENLSSDVERIVEPRREDSEARDYGSPDSSRRATGGSSPLGWVFPGLLAIRRRYPTDKKAEHRDVMEDRPPGPRAGTRLLEDCFTTRLASLLLLQPV
jgi:hypothetical protein